MARLWAKTATFETVQPGDRFPVLLKWETRDSIVRFALPGGEASADKPEAGASVSEATLRAYVTELLQKGFPAERVAAPGGSVELEILETMAAGEIITLSGQVTGKREAGGLRLVESEIVIENQAGQVTARARAAVPF